MEPGGVIGLGDGDDMLGAVFLIDDSPQFFLPPGDHGASPLDLRHALDSEHQAPHAIRFPDGLHELVVGLMLDLADHFEAIGAIQVSGDHELGIIQVDTQAREDGILLLFAYFGMAQDEGAVLLLKVLNLVTPIEVPIFGDLLEAPDIILAGELSQRSADDLLSNGLKEVGQLKGTILVGNLNQP